MLKLPRTPGHQRRGFIVRSTVSFAFGRSSYSCSIGLRSSSSGGIPFSSFYIPSRHYNSRHFFSSSSASNSKSKSQSKSKSSRRKKLTLAFCVAPLLLALPCSDTISALQPSEKPRLNWSTLTPPLSFSIWASPSPSPPPSISPPNSTMLGRPFKPTKSIASGRPETLTVEEEAKLKRLWHAALKVFAVAGPDPEETPSATSSTSGSPVSGPASPTSPDDKRRKSHSLGRFFHRREEKEAKKQEASTPPTPKSETLATSAGDDDKYGSKQDFLAALASQTPEELRTAFWMMVKCDNPDGLLLRFLRARKWDVDKALVMMISTMSWRLKQMDVEKLMETGDEGAIIAGDEGFMKQLRMGKSYLHGVDIEGRPICYVRVRLHNKADQSEQSLERYTVYIMETARLMLSPPVDTAAVVFDMTGFSLANMDYAPVKFMIKCFEAHYPESLGICLVHKAPWVFRGIWNIIKGWLDPVVATKIHFTESLEDMEAFIPRSQILAELGGDEAWSYTYDEPVPGENAPLKDTARREKLQKERDELVLEYEEQTRRWVVEREEVAAGRIKDQRNAIAGKIKAGYWGLDKHVRARTIYDRRGVLGPNGELNFYGDRGRVGGKVETSEEDID